MIESKKINIIAAIAMALALLVTVVMLAFPDGEAKEALKASSKPVYATQIFGTDIISINIIVDETEWQNMLDNAMNEEYISADVVINNKRFSNVGIRPKGNNSLQQVASSDSDRYSFKIKFDEYVDGQTCWGLDMLVLNNMVGDATYMKEYLTFDMMSEMGVETPYYGYSNITVNGGDWGFYFTLEAYNDSYEQRVSGDTSGNLYNVKISDGFGGNSVPENFSANRTEKTHEEEVQEIAERTFGRTNRGGGMGGMGASSTGGSLVYTDDESSSYSAIFGNAVGSDSNEEDYQKVITALKALNGGENIEEYFDVDGILRYLAVHTVVVNLDSYSSTMAQNYYIYEYDGVLQILPWDYNYAWGAFQSGNASDVVNFPIDTPVSGVEMSERPLISKLFENEEYLERYHSYLKELMDNYFADGKFAAKVDEINSVIGKYVEKDASAFYTYDEYQTALEAFKNLADLRMESIYGQLDGTVPSTNDEQDSNPDKLIDASSVNLSDLGSDTGGGGMGFGGNKGGFGGFGNFNGSGGNFPSSGMPDNGNIPDMNGNAQPPEGMPQMPENGFTQNNSEDNFAPNIPDVNENPAISAPDDFTDEQGVQNNSGAETPPEKPNAPENGNDLPQMPENGFQNDNNKDNNTENIPVVNQNPDNLEQIKTERRSEVVGSYSESTNENGKRNLAEDAVSAGALVVAIIGASLVKRKF